MPQFLMHSTFVFIYVTAAYVIYVNCYVIVLDCINHRF